MPTILVVDDTAVDRRLAGGLLEKYPNLSVTYAESGGEAIDSIKQSVPDLVLTDLQMPDIDGLQLVSSINTNNPDIPVVLMTAHGSENVAAQALANGAASYVPKDDLADNLVETITHILAMSNSDRRYNALIQCSTKTEFEFSLENDLNLVDPLVELIQEVVSSMRICDPTERIRMGVALENALVNSILRGNLEVPKSEHNEEMQQVDERQQQSPYSERRVYVNALINRDLAQFVIRDEGPGFNTGQSPKPGDPDSIRSSGRGLVLMRNFMDECNFNSKGNEVTMIKRRSA